MTELETTEAPTTPSLQVTVTNAVAIAVKVNCSCGNTYTQVEPDYFLVDEKKSGATTYTRDKTLTPILLTTKYLDPRHCRVCPACLSPILYNSKQGLLDIFPKVQPKAQSPQKKQEKHRIHRKFADILRRD